jgi:hypothetical protein
MWNAAEPVVAIVSLEETGLAPGVTLFEENEQEAIAGRLEHDSATALLNGPLEGVIVTV